MRRRATAGGTAEPPVRAPNRFHRFLRAPQRRRPEQHVRRHSLSHAGLRPRPGHRVSRRVRVGRSAAGRGRRGPRHSVPAGNVGRPPRLCRRTAPCRRLRTAAMPATTYALARPSHFRRAAGFPSLSRGHYEDQHRRGVAARRSLARRAAAGSAGRGRRGAAERAGRRPCRRRRRLFHLSPSGGVSRCRRASSWSSGCSSVSPAALRSTGASHGFRQVVVYYRDGRYYDRTCAAGPLMREVVVYERNGRYYQVCDEREWQRRYHGPHRARRTTATGTTDLSCAFRRLITQIQVGCRTRYPRPRRGYLL